MPNLGYVIECPYYKSDKLRSITCEDTIRFYNKPEKKQEHIEAYCAGDWKKCPFAQRLQEVYEGSGHGFEDLYRHYADVRYRELIKVISMTGKKDGVITRLEDEIWRYKAQLDVAEKAIARRVQSEKALREKSEAAFKQINTLANMYDQIFAYLLAGSMMKSIDLEAVDAWAKEHEWRLIPEKGEDEHIIAWKVEVRDSGSEHGDDGSSGEAEKTSRGEAEKGRSKKSKS